MCVLCRIRLSTLGYKSLLFFKKWLRFKPNTKKYFSMMKGMLMEHICITEPAWKVQPYRNVWYKKAAPFEKSGF